MISVAVIGASNDPAKYSYLALKLLAEKGYKAIPVHPKLQDIEGQKVYASLHEIPDPIHTVTLYVSKAVSAGMKDEIVGKKVKRVIFNPGAENPELQEALKAQGIQTLEACTLVLLRTNQF